MENSNDDKQTPVTIDFCRAAPKVELHAHLHGCMRKSTLQEYMKARDIKFEEKDFITKDMNEAFKIFDFIHQAIDSLDQIKRMVQEMLEDFAAENTVYMELRTTPRPMANSTMEDYISTVIEQIKEYESQNPDKLKARLLISINRSESVEKARETLEVAKKFFSTGYVVGLDYSGNPFKNSFTDFQDIFEQGKKFGLKASIHCAELPDEKTLKETADVLNFKPDRLGHFNYFNEDLFKRVHELNIPIEMCPTSNKYTMYLKDYNDHHFIKYFKTKHPISLCTDDTVVFDTNLSEEYYRIFKAFDLSSEEAKEVIKRSYECIFDESVKKSLRALSF